MAALFEWARSVAAAPAINAVASTKRVRSGSLTGHAAAVGPSDAGRGRPYDAWLDVIGVISAGVRDGGRATGEQFTAIVREKARARRAR